MQRANSLNPINIVRNVIYFTGIEMQKYVIYGIPFSNLLLWKFVGNVKVSLKIMMFKIWAFCHLSCDSL